jgi:nicotinamidase-related amidase
MKALLIIDMQRGCFTPYSSRYNTMDVIDRINKLADRFRSKRLPVIFIQHDGSREGELFPNTEAWTLLPELSQQANDLYVSKTANDSFYRSTLEQRLSSLGVDELFITGSATDFCVDATVKSALTKDYKVTVISDAHTTGDRAHISAKTLIDHYNWIWSDMSPTIQKINVVEANVVNI